jgi:hypothetical protein
MSRDEIDSGALENVLFVGGRFRKYLLAKNAVVAASALGLSLIIFSAFSLYALFARQFELHAFLQLGVGVLAGLYYVAAAGFLSLFFKGGSNVLLILLGQVLMFVGLLFTASQRMGLAGRLTASSFPGLAAELEFTAVSLVFPNSVVALRSWVAVAGLAFMTAVFLSLQLWRITSLELRRR